MLLRSRLLALQPIEELRRKANKSFRRKGKHWTQEEIECSERAAKETSLALFLDQHPPQ